jgi:transcriptional regulator with XRE-family HTH domain
MEGDETWDEYMARRLQDPDYAKAHAIGRPFLHLSLNLWSLRLTKGLTQQQLAESAGMKQPRIASIERDQTNPTLETISRIACALGVTADRLLAEPDGALLAKARAIVDVEIATWSPARRRALGLLEDDGGAESQTGARGTRRRTA